MLTHDEAFRFDLCGYLVLRDVLPRAPLFALGQRIAALDDTPPEALPHSIPVWTPVLDEYRILNILDPCPDALDYVDNDVVMERLEGLLPDPFRLTEAYTITRGAGVGLYLHDVPAPLSTYTVVDGRPRCTYVKVTIPLTDCGPEDGPFCVLAGSHKRDVAFPYSHFDPSWEFPDHDRHVLDVMRGHERGRPEVDWRELPGFTELTASVGDVIVFTESLLHGARAVRSNRQRRALFLGYGPYSCVNWHGVEYSSALLARASARQRRLLAGPFVGFRYESARAPIEDDPRFPFYPNSERAAAR